MEISPTPQGKPTGLQSHPFADLFPVLPPPQMKELVASIKRDGLQTPIVKFGDLILDGRCRYAACQIACVEPQFVEYDGAADSASLVAFIQAANIHRRHMTPSQLAMVAAKLSKAAGYDDKGPRGPFIPTTQAIAAITVGASIRSTKRAVRVLENSPSDVIAAIEQNEVPLADAAAIATKPAAEQKAALQKVRSGKAKSLRSAISGGTTFDPSELEAVPSAPAPKLANGRPVVSTQQRKEAFDTLAKLCRTLSKIGIYDEFIVSLSQIAERLKQL